MQNVTIKAALAAVGLVGLAASHQAAAAIPNAASGNGDLVFVVVDTVTGATFAQDTGKSISSFLPSNNASFTDTITSDPGYTSLLAEAGTNALAYAIVGGGYGNLAINGQSNYYVSTTGAATLSTTTAISNLNLTNFNLIDQNLINPLNGNPPTSTGNSWFIPAGTIPNYTPASWLPTWNGHSTFNTLSSPGTASNFYFLTGSGSSGRSTDTLIGSMNFAAGVLTYTSNNASAVPLPAAVWLLGSGLVGLMGIGRRRAA
jgi:hypothetical protein